MKKLLIIVASIVVIGGCAAAVSSGSDEADFSADSGSSSQDSGSSEDTGSTETQPEPAANPDEGTFKIIVKSTGSNQASVTYVRPDSDSMAMSQDTAANLPWTKKFKNVEDLPMGWNMNAQQDGGGTLTCIIEHNGEVIAKNKSKGDYAMVTCSS